MKKFSNIMNRLLIGFKKGLSVPTLPDHIIVLQNNVFIRILRVLGGLSVILIVTHKLNFLGNGILYIICLSICTILTFMFTIYLLYINYYRIKHMYKVWKSDDLDVRNSPFDRLASFATRLIWCSKGFCDFAAPIGISYGALAGLDELR